MPTPHPASPEQPKIFRWQFSFRRKRNQHARRHATQHPVESSGGQLTWRGDQVTARIGSASIEADRRASPKARSRCAQLPSSTSRDVKAAESTGVWRSTCPISAIALGAPRDPMKQLLTVKSRCRASTGSPPDAARHSCSCSPHPGRSGAKHRRSCVICSRPWPCPLLPCWIRPILVSPALPCRALHG